MARVHRHDVAALDAIRAQYRRDACARSIECAVRQGRGGVDGRDVAGRSSCLCHEELMRGRSGQCMKARGRVGQSSPSVVRDEGESGDLFVRIGGDSPEQMLVLREHLRHSLLVEEVGVVDEIELDVIAALTRIQR